MKGRSIPHIRSKFPRTQTLPRPLDLIVEGAPHSSSGRSSPFLSSPWHCKHASAVSFDRPFTAPMNDTYPEGFSRMASAAVKRQKQEKLGDSKNRQDCTSVECRGGITVRKQSAIGKSHLSNRIRTQPGSGSGSSFQGFTEIKLLVESSHN